MITSIVAKITFREFILHAMTSMSIHVLLQSSASEQHETDLGIRSRSRNVAVRSGVASYWALDTCPPSPPQLPTISFLVHFGVNLTANYPSIMQSARSAGADVNNSQLFRSVLH